MLEHDIIKKRRVDKKITELEFEAGDSKEYEVEAVWDNVVYANKAKGHPPGLYYLVLGKKYLKEENTWEPSSAVQHLKKLINFFHKKYPKKPAATFLSIDSTPSMTRSIVKPTRLIIKRKQGQPINNANK